MRKSLLALAAAAAFALPSVARAADDVVIAMGSISGSTYALGIQVSEILRDKFPSISVDVKSGGALGNVLLVDKGRATFGHTSSGLAFSAYQGLEPFKDKAENIRGMAKFMDSIFQFAILDSAPVKSFEEIKQQHYPLKLAVGPKGRENELLSRRVLEAYGITYDMIEDWGGRIEFVNIGDASSLLRDGHIDAVTMLSGIPYGPITEITSARPLRFLALNDDVRKQLDADYGYVDATIQPGSYDGQDQAIGTIGGGVILVANKDADAEVIYQATKWINSPEGIKSLGALSGGIRDYLTGPAAGRAGLPIPLHEGAARFYQEAGIQD
ncbi:TAXI family TRAP transporter solute-binding subunit [Consotaella salsifontis]|uniref:TRAP transporter solute receptor, TAXI family n=1 Tax=Consotaella salsifontis TaxID=1365950 RepID=A0A1T4S3R6_9HYPH|nr:TAXI family TRAP transporter solute-binding subunit [Consotaella salsifontis]SKA22461.1 hypothetical protein SAMN05428963_108207 [Consotaella salsifontis]